MSKPITKANPRTIQSGPLAGRTFTTERAYREALRNVPGKKPATRIIGSAAKLAQLSSQEYEVRNNAFRVVAMARRENISITAALRKASSEGTKTSLQSIRKYAGSSIIKNKRGRYEVKEYDKLSRSMTMVTPDGNIQLIINDSRTASLIGQYWNAVADALGPLQDDSALKQFKGKGITVNGVNYPFITDTEVLSNLQDSGLLDVKIYAGQAAV